MNLNLEHQTKCNGCRMFIVNPYNTKSDNPFVLCRLTGARRYLFTPLYYDCAFYNPSKLTVFKYHLYAKLLRLIHKAHHIDNPLKTVEKRLNKYLSRIHTI